MPRWLDRFVGPTSIKERPKLVNRREAAIYRLTTDYFRKIEYLERQKKVLINGRNTGLGAWEKPIERRAREIERLRAELVDMMGFYGTGRYLISGEERERLERRFQIPALMDKKASGKAGKVGKGERQETEKMRLLESWESWQDDEADAEAEKVRIEEEQEAEKARLEESWRSWKKEWGL